MKQHPTPPASPHLPHLRDRRFRGALALAAALGLGALSLTACDDRGSAATGLPAPVPTSDAGAGKVETAPLTPEAKCRNLLLAVCAKDTACGFAALSEAACLAQFTQVDCSLVSAVGDSYDACMHDIPLSSCPVTNLPAACTQVLIY
jgi:hypothetical protein